MKTDNRRADARSALQERIGDELPRLSPRDTVELAGIVERLVEALRPERIYAFGSHARGDTTPDSDVDLAVIVARSDGPPHRREQAALRGIGLRLMPLDVLVLTKEEFNTHFDTPSSLSGTIQREGRTLYPAA